MDQGTHVVWWAISPETWAIVLATFIGPVAAIIVSIWNDKRRELRSRRVGVFRTLLATRGRAITEEHVESVNLIEFDFFGVEPITSSWRTYMNHLNSVRRDHVMSPQENEIFEDKRTDLLAKLLSVISTEMRMNMSEIDLKRGGYAPAGWAAREKADAELKQAAFSMLTGRTVPIVRPETPGLSSSNLNTP